MYKLFLILLSIIFLGCSSEDYQSIHNEALVVDLHSDTPLKMLRGLDISKRDSTGHMDIPRLIEGGIDLQVMACFVSTDRALEDCPPRVNELIDSIEAQVYRNPLRLYICRNPKEVERTVEAGKIAIVLGIENGVAINNSLERLRHFFQRGVRYLTLTHTSSSDWCISSADTAPAFDGLTEFGREVIGEMNRLGMIVDISHAHPSAVDEVLKITTQPVIASHSCVHAICEHDRNLTDEQIKAIAANGGMIGINFYTNYLSTACIEKSKVVFDKYESTLDSLREEFKEDRRGYYGAAGYIYDEVEDSIYATGIDAGTIVDHIDYIVDLVGADYAGLGSDFDGIPWLPANVKDCSMVPNITRELVIRGYKRDEILKILGGNFMRIFEQVCGS